MSETPVIGRADTSTNTIVSHADAQAFLESLPHPARRNLIAEATAGQMSGFVLTIQNLLPITFAGLGASGGALIGPTTALCSAVIGFGLGLGGGLIVINITEKHSIRRYLSSACVNRRLQRCPGCDYDLQGARSDNCSECGGPVRVGTGHTESAPQGKPAGSSNRPGNL